MTHIFNRPEAFMEESLEGFAAVHSDLVRQVPGGIVRRGMAQDGSVSIVLGGGSGHYPMFHGLVGEGLADGAVVGNIFTSPSTQYACDVARRADRGGGVIFCYGNYAGDVMNFGLAVERLEAEGIAARSMVVTDDVLSAGPDEREKRRGLAGDFVVMRAMVNVAATGATIDEVLAAGERANAATRTVGVGFAGCTFPGADHRLFEVAAGKMGIGLGAHGEPGQATIEALSSAELALELVRHVESDLPAGASDRIGVIVNGMGATKAEEMFVLWRDLLPLFAERGWTPIEPEVGEIITSLDMAGLSLTITWLTEELEKSWKAPAYGPGYRKGTVALANVQQEVLDDEVERVLVVPEATGESRAAARVALEGLRAAYAKIQSEESTLADADAVAGDGDHGRGMVRGLSAAVAGAQESVEAGAGLGTTLMRAGGGWADQAGGTSGVLWGAALRACGEALGDTHAPTQLTVLEGARAFEARIRSLGKVEVGDKTMLDAIVPAVEALAAAFEAGSPLQGAGLAAAAAAESAADGTAVLRPRVGRARPLAELSVGHSDPGAMSFAMVLRAAFASEIGEGSGVV